MKPVRNFAVVPNLPASIEGLRKLAFNLRWAWSHDTVELFRRLDRDLWEASGHNPVAILGCIEQEKLQAAAADDAFLGHLRRAESNLDAYLDSPTTWFHKTYGKRADKPLIAYFSAEFGLTECLSIFAGGLGILAGDHLKSASDLGLPLIGVGLLYQQGYFRQLLSQSGWQQEHYDENDFDNLPLTRVCHDDGAPILVSVDMLGRTVYAQIWRVQVGRVALFLLDTNIDKNSNPVDRDITDQLYGGNRETRIRQEIILGIGGYRALHAMGLHPTVYHMNEGHSAFLAIEHLRSLQMRSGLSFAEAKELASASLVFTTHTPVEAGHDSFSPDLMLRYFGGKWQELGISQREFMDLGRVPGKDDFCMTVLALKMASHANGVSQLHGEVSRKMWQSLWPNVPVNEIPIQHVTNGVHFCSWISLEMNQLYDRYLAPDWRDEPANAEIWNRAKRIPAEELWRTHERRRERLVAWARSRVRNQRIRRGASQAEIAAAVEVLDPDALSIGFARRFATYKRATLIFHDMQRLKRILTNPERPVQLIFAGKAHPADDAGKELIRKIVEFSRDPELGRRIVFLEDYDMAVARYLVQGVDVWLNNPLRPMEASGTSGMKAAANAVLNLSSLDGWWDEVWRDPNTPSLVGWAIGNGEDYDDPKYQDQVEAEILYDVLERDVIPTFYDRGPDRIPRRWVERMKACIGSLCHFVNTHRMVRDYMCGYYEPAHERTRILHADDARRARELSAAVNRIAKHWGDVWVGNLEDAPHRSVLVASPMEVRAEVHLGALKPEDVAVELYVGRVNSEGDIVNGAPIPMECEGRDGDTYRYAATTTIARSGRHGFTIRVRPYHPDMAHSFLPGMICWAGQAANAVALG